MPPLIARVPAVQLQDISSWGSGAEVAKTLLPKGARVQRFTAGQIERAPRDTRSLKGVIDLPPLTVYRCALLYAERALLSLR